jgi:TusA-related sulfurtransferase
MPSKRLDITGKVCPYCLLAVQNEVKSMKPADELIVTSDSPTASTSSIPRFALDNNLDISSTKIESGLWEIRLKRK